MATPRKNPPRQTEIKIPVNTETEAESADNEVELTPEERALAEQSLDDDEWGPEGGASIGEVVPENEDEPAYQSDVDSEEGLTSESEVVSADEPETVQDGDLAEDEVQEENQTPLLESAAEPVNAPPPQNNIQPVKRTSRRTTVPKTYQPPEPKPANAGHVHVLEDGDLMEGVNEHAAFPDHLASADECLKWMEMNNLTARQQENNRTWIIYSGANEIIGAGGSLSIACHAAGMRVVQDSDVENP